MVERFPEQEQRRGPAFEYRPELAPVSPEVEPEGPRVVGLFISPDKGVPMLSQSTVHAVAGKGLEGDRYLLGKGAYSKSKPPKVRDISIISLEAIQAANEESGPEFTQADTRRNIVVTGMELNQLGGQTIRLGGVTIQVTGLCEPCDRPSGLSKKSGFKSRFENRGGIRGRILNDGEIKIGSKFEIVPQSASQA